MHIPGPALLLTAWALHDVEEALAFPSTCDALADRTNIEFLRIGKRESWAAVGLMGIFVTAVCWRGLRTGGRSSMYRATLAGLEAHVYSHLAASALQRRYTAGVATALPIMLPGAIGARRELRHAGAPLRIRNYLLGACLLVPGAVICQVLARLSFQKKRD